MLLKKIKGKYLVFDKGNISENNFKEIDSLCKEWSCHFVTSVRPSLIRVKEHLLSLKIEEQPVIYEQKHTKLRDKTSTIFLYDGDKKERNVLLYVNEEIARKKQEEFLELLNDIQEKVSEINQRQDEIEDKSKAVERLLRKKKVFSYLCGVKSCMLEFVDLVIIMMICLGINQTTKKSTSRWTNVATSSIIKGARN